MTIESGAAARIVSAYGPPMPPPPAPRPPRPAAIGGSTVLSFHVPEKFAVPWAGRIAGSISASASAIEAPLDMIAAPLKGCPMYGHANPRGVVTVVFISRSSLRRAGGLRHQRLRFVEVRRIGAGARPELLRPAAER